MQWKIILMNLPNILHERDNNFQVMSNLGSREDVLKTIVEILPTIEFHGTTEGVVDEEDLYLEIDINFEDYVSSISMFIYSEDEAGILKIFKRIQEKSNWQAFDTITGTFIDFENNPLKGFQKLKNNLERELLQDEREEQRQQQLFDKYQRKSYIAIIPYLLLVGILTFIWFKLFLYLGNLVYTNIGKGIILIHPEGYIWFLPALFVGFITAIPLLLYFYQWIYQKNFDEFQEYLELASSAIARTILRFLAVIYIVIAVGYVGLSMNWYTRFAESEIVLNRFWSFREISYSYKEIKLIYTISDPAGEEKIAEPYFVIVFEDGEQWISNEQEFEMSSELYNEIILLVSTKSDRKPIK